MDLQEYREMDLNRYTGKRATVNITLYRSGMFSKFHEDMIINRYILFDEWIYVEFIDSKKKIQIKKEDVL